MTVVSDVAKCIMESVHSAVEQKVCITDGSLHILKITTTKCPHVSFRREHGDIGPLSRYTSSCDMIGGGCCSAFHFTNKAKVRVVFSVTQVQQNTNNATCSKALFRHSLHSTISL